MDTLDLLILGSGVAGLSAAVRAAEVEGLRVGVLTKAELDQATTRWAQGGVAAALGGDPDSTDLHLADTLAAGAGLCDADAVRVLVDEGPDRVHELIALGAVFDVDADGRLLTTTEGGHSHPRVVHAGGAATGAEVERALVHAVRRTAAAVMEGCFALDLVLDGSGRCAGVTALDPGGRRFQVPARHVLLATGGAGQLYSVTTNPLQATGDGIAMALRAGAVVADVEFVQFHPTALHHPKMPRPLLSEALRGHGALLRDADGARFVDELLPRDQVARAMAARMAEQGAEHLWLDATGIERFAQRFPTIAASLAEVGLDPSSDWLPIAPAAHYLCGGVVTDLRGATTVAGLWACGETACTGVHGANRLASNSLLEGMVFAPRVVEAVAGGIDGAEPSGAMAAVLGSGSASGADQAGRPPLVATLPATAFAPAAGDTPVVGGDPRRDALQRAMSEGAGVVRTAGSLASTQAALDDVAAALDPADEGPAAWEIRNLLTVAGAVLAAAGARRESRGGHIRLDHPDPAAAFAGRIAVTAAAAPAGGTS